MDSQRKKGAAEALVEIDHSCYKRFKKNYHRWRKSRKSVKHDGGSTFISFSNEIVEFRRNSADYSHLKQAVQFRLNCCLSESDWFGGYTAILAIMAACIGVIFSAAAGKTAENLTQYSILAVTLLLLVLFLIFLMLQKSGQVCRRTYYQTILDLWLEDESRDAAKQK